MKLLCGAGRIIIETFGRPMVPGRARIAPQRGARPAAGAFGLGVSVASRVAVGSGVL